MSYTKKNEKLLLTYELDTSFSESVMKEIINDLEKEKETPEKFESVLLDARNLPEIDHKIFKLIAPIGLSFKKLNKKIYLLTRQKHIAREIRELGIDSLIQCIQGNNEMFSPPKELKKEHKLDVSFVNPFIDGAIETLKIQCKTDVTVEKVILKKPEENLMSIDIAGIIGITSQIFNSSIALCFPGETFIAVMNRMLDEEHTEINQDIEDGAAEILNMISGYARRILSENGHKLENAIPSIVRADHLLIKHLIQQSAVIVLFNSDCGSFYIEIGV